MLIVTVCTANLCRSPLAALALHDALARHGVDADVLSTGVEALDGMPPPPDWVEVCDAVGVDLRAHRSRRPGEWLLDADVVLAMTAGHLRAVVAERPGLIGRATTLGAAAIAHGDPHADDPALCLVAARSARDVLLTSNDQDVPDPFARPRRVQRAVAADIMGRVARVAVLLGGADRWRQP